MVLVSVWRVLPSANGEHKVIQLGRGCQTDGQTLAGSQMTELRAKVYWHYEARPFRCTLSSYGHLQLTFFTKRKIAIIGLLPGSIGILPLS